MYDPGIFYIKIRDKQLILTVHVDNCILTSSSTDLIEQCKTLLNSQCPPTDLGPIHWVLGIEVTCNHNAHTISLSQSLYINTILCHFNLQDAKAYGSPMMPGTLLTTRNTTPNTSEMDYMSKIPYCKAIGSFMYASIAMHLDISFAMAFLSQSLNNPSHTHWEVTKQIFHYLSGTKNIVLTFGSKKHDLIGYTDTDGTSQSHCKAISSFTFLIDGSMIS